MIRDGSSGRRRARGATDVVGMCWELLEATGPLQSWSFIFPGHMELKFNIEREREKKKPSFNGRSGLKLASECGLDRSQAGERGNFPALSQKVP